MKIIPLTEAHLAEYAEVIRRSFATVANDFGYTRENCPTHRSFVTDEQLRSKIAEKIYPFGCVIDEKIIGLVSFTDQGGGIFEINNMAILPEYRHMKYGTKLIEFCKAKVVELGGDTIVISIIDESTVLKKWYAANGFIQTGTQKYDGLLFTVGYMKWTINEVIQ